MPSKKYIPSTCAILVLLVPQGSLAVVGEASGHTFASDPTTSLHLSSRGSGEQMIASQGRPWTTSDSIAVRSFDTDTINISPDGSKFFFVSSHGDLSCDCNVYELSLFLTEDIKKALEQGSSTIPSPMQHLVRKSYDHSGAEFANARWERDGKSILFEGSSEPKKRQLFRLEVISGEVVELTNWPYGIYIYPKVYGRSIIAPVPIPDEAPASSPTYPMYVLNNDRISSILNAHLPRTKAVTFVSYAGAPPWALQTVRLQSAVPSTADGNRLIAVALVQGDRIPAAWSAYDRWSHSKAQLKPEDMWRFILIDAKGGREKPVFDAPSGLSTEVGYSAGRNLPPTALWADDARHVVLVNTSLPIDSRPDAKNMSYIVGYDADSSKWEVIEPLEKARTHGGAVSRVIEVGWLVDGRELLIRHEVDNKTVEGTVYQLQGGRWKGRSVSGAVTLPPRRALAPSAMLPTGLSVGLRQSENDPPIMVASDGKHQLALVSPDPALAGLIKISQQPFEWREPGGQLRKGGLLLPRQSDGGLPPLVIQPYLYDPDKFRPETSGTTYAGQSLAARGMAVLTVTIPAYDPSKINTVRELTDFVAELESAVDALAARKLIDRKRVGLMGFSRAGYETLYAITHPGRIVWGAAVIDDAYPGTYGYSLMRGIFFGDGRMAYGGTFWQNKKLWLEHEPTFNIDQAKTPSLTIIHNQSSVPYSLDTIGAFAINRKPQETLVFPFGSHGLEMPRERLAIQDAAVEWMAFWLQGKQPADPERTLRWNSIKAEWNKTLADEDTAHGKNAR